MMNFSKRIASILVVCQILLFAGCDSNQVRIFQFNGKVIFEDGSPAKFGIIEFRSDSVPPVTARGKINSDGTFRVKTSGRSWGLTEGSHRAIIIQVIGNPRVRGKVHHHHGLVVADKYRDYDTSGLKVEVKPDNENDFEFVVESK